MKIGQVVKNTLNELSKQNWHIMRDLWGEPILAIETTVEPIFSQAVEILIEAGITNLKDRDKLIRSSLERGIYIRLESYSQENQDQPVPASFFKDLEIAINDYVQQLSSGWIESSTSIDETITTKCGDEIFIAEHSHIGKSDTLLRILARQQGYYDNYPDMLAITNSTKKQITSHSDFIIGKNNFVTQFINIISADLSPSYYYLESKKTKKAEITPLKNLCIKSISRYSLFYLDEFSIDMLPNYKIPEELLRQIEESPMEHAQKWQDIDRYKEKFIIYKTTSYDLGSKHGYLVYPERKELKVGMVGKSLLTSTNETGYILKMLITPNEVVGSCVLFTSKIKYSNLKIRLPLPGELDKIKKAVLSGEGIFIYHDTDQIIKAIDSQKIESEKLIFEENYLVPTRTML